MSSSPVPFSLRRRIRLLDVVALTRDIQERGLVRGHVGTVVETYGNGTVEVEFSDVEGRTYALVAVPSDQLMVLHHRPVRSA